MATKAKRKKAVARKFVGKKLGMADASTTFKMRQAVVKKPSISFEDACKEAGIKPVPGSHGHNVFVHASHVLSMFTAQYGNR